MQHISLDQIVANKNQPRQTFYEGSLKELAASIQERGVLEPIVVRPRDGKYEIVMGERRFRAACLAGLTEIPAVVREMSDEDMASDALLENFQREDLNPIDRATAIEGLLAFMTWEKCAKTLGVSESTLRRHLELLELPEALQKALVESWGKTDNFSEAHARQLKSMNSDPGTQRRLLEKIRAEGLSVSDTQRLIDAIRRIPEKKEAFLRVPLRVTEEILKQMGKAQKKSRPFKSQTAERHLESMEKGVSQLSDIIDERLIDYLKSDQMNQLLSTCTSFAEELDKFTRKLRDSLKKGDDGFREVYIHCPLCGRIELIGSLKCGVCWSVLRRCTDCGNYDRTYQRCAISQDYVYGSDAESPRETSKSYKCTDYKPKFEARKVA
ncbi:MAG: ParB/RepB/Spo0J family partition protein [Armatimonadota bacterium]